MTKLKLGPLADDRPVKLAVELPAAVHRDLVAYAAALAAETGGEAKRDATGLPGTLCASGGSARDNTLSPVEPVSRATCVGRPSRTTVTVYRRAPSKGRPL